MQEKREIRRVYDLDEFSRLIGRPRGFYCADVTKFNEFGEKVGVTFKQEEAKEVDLDG